jgi:uncharacterized protein YndB with AHSA1/START domain
MTDEQGDAAMSAQTTIANVKAAVTVDVPQARAFEVFTRDYASWVPDGQYLSKTRPLAIVIEPKKGGRIFERAADGTEMDWGLVHAFEPSSRFVYGWHLNAMWQFVADPAQASEVEVRFTPEGPNKTRVELEHRHFERHGEGAENLRAAVASEGGWPLTLDSFAKAATK